MNASRFAGIRGGPLQKSVNALDPFFAPRFDRFQRSKEHFKKSERVCPVGIDHHIRADHITHALGHLVAVLAENETLVKELLVRLGVFQNSLVI